LPRLDASRKQANYSVNEKSSGASHEVSIVLFGSALNSEAFPSLKRLFAAAKMSAILVFANSQGGAQPSFKPAAAWDLARGESAGRQLNSFLIGSQTRFGLQSFRFASKA
jgi:hypothetical protein